MDPYELLRIFMLALAVYREGRGEPKQGKLAVASVIINRAADPRWPAEVRDVVLQPKQFSSFNLDDSQVIVFPNAKDDPAWVDCVEAVYEVLSTGHDYSNGANHYFSNVIEPPKWADPHREVLRIGRHIFFRL